MVHLGRPGADRVTFANARSVEGLEASRGRARPPVLVTDHPDADTTGQAYTDRLATLEQARWKQLLDVQAPYRWNLRRLLGQRRVLDIGCGIGRNLAHLGAGSVGVDHNRHSVRTCRDRGLTAFTDDEFLALPPNQRGRFGGLLAAHVVEHLPPGCAAEVLAPYLDYLENGREDDPDRIVLICPQQRGFASDPTHTVYFDQDRLAQLCTELGLVVDRQFSFPFPTWMGRAFTYNEFVTVARR